MSASSFAFPAPPSNPNGDSSDGNALASQVAALAQNWIVDQDMDPMSEDEQLPGLEAAAAAAAAAQHAEASLSLAQPPGLNSSWVFQGAMLFPTVDDILEGLNNPLPSYPYYLDANGMPLIQSAGLAPPETLLDEDQPSVSDHNMVQDICEFISKWAITFVTTPDSVPIGPAAARIRKWERPPTVAATELNGDRCDIQGIDWTRLDTTRDQARKARAMFYQRHESKAYSQDQGWTRRLPARENYFRFRQMNTSPEIRPYISHFQLRNLVTATSQADIYYAGKFQVACTDGHQVKSVMDLTPSSTTWQQSRPLQITCLSSSDDALVVGGFNGEYALTHLNPEKTADIVHGYLTHEVNGITNHVHTFNHRHSRLTQAAFCSNDQWLRILDCYTNTITHGFQYSFPINCSATSPDGRLRMVVGDNPSAILTNAETGVQLERMVNHREDIFACAWADDGIHVATGAQDSRVVIYDARRWDRPLANIGTDLACPRSLRFSPAGSGKRLLFVAEASDFVNVIDAATFESCQTLDFFGAIGGMALTPDGDSLYVANCDPKFGGIVQYDNTAAFPTPSPAPSFSSTSSPSVLPPSSSSSSLFRNPDHDSPFSTSSTAAGITTAVLPTASDTRRRRRHHAFHLMTAPGMSAARYAASQKSHDWFDEATLDERGKAGTTAQRRFRKGLGLEELMI